MTRVKKLTLVLCALVVLTGCAIRNSNISTETQWQLNTVSQLTDLQANYITFFKDVGDAHRAGTLTDSDVKTLNAIGDRLKTSIEIANQSWKAYAAAPSGDKKTQIVNLILVAEQVLLELTTKKVQLTKGVK